MLSIGYREALKISRLRKKLTQKECAGRVGMSDKTWSKYETGTATLTDASLAVMRRALECTEKEMWHLALPVQRMYHDGREDEIREDAPEYATPLSAGALEGLSAVDVKALPAEEQHWFSGQLKALNQMQAAAQAMSDGLWEKFLKLTMKAREGNEDTADDKDAEDDRY